MKRFEAAIVLSLICLTCHPQTQSTESIVTKTIAFPGAEGFGKYATGGRGGKVFIVSNLDDKGAGSFRDAAESKEIRIIVFAVSGTIHLETNLSIKGNCTIAGQTAPGDGICIADHPVLISGDNIIVRFIRIRMGDKNQNKGKVDGSGDDDAFGGTHRKNIIIDHCSISWSTDEAFSVYAGDSTTLQWNLISEPLDYSYHFEKGDSDYEHHGYGGIWGGKHSSFHHNLFAHCNSRNPRFDGIRNTPEENCDYRNNVIYDWGGNSVYAGEGGSYNMVNNYYKPGPSTHIATRWRIVTPYKLTNIPFGKFYVGGNYVDDAPNISRDNSLGVVFNQGNPEDKKNFLMSVEFPFEPIATQTAEQAYQLVLQKVGATRPARDTLDQRIINDVINRTGKIIDVQGGYPHGTVYERTVNAWPNLRSSHAPEDGDKDGMPDGWEKKQGLDPKDNSDAIGNKLSKQYTNVEMYINELSTEK